jgi:hypothetical protein
MTWSQERRRTWLVIAALSALAIASYGFERRAYPRNYWPVDFRAFYCAGAVAAEHRDPYRTEPLRTCENVAWGYPRGRGVQFALPAPLPGYALVPFVLLSRFPYYAAAGLWCAVLLASFALTVVLLTRLCELRAGTVFAALFIEALYAFLLGQIVPLVCLATVAAAFFVARGRDRAAAGAASFAMLEPHLGLPVCLALFIARPRARATLAGLGAAFALVSVALLGPDTSVEYVRSVLPAHALSEISHEAQYSLTYLAALAGIGDRAAVVLGALSYIVMAGLGIAAGRIAAAKTGNQALLLLVPPAFAALGGTFIHVQQLAIALPAALVLSATRIREARLCAVAVMLLALPWSATAFLMLNLPAVLAVIFLLTIDLFGHSPIRAALATAATTAVIAGLLVGLGTFPMPAIGPLDPAQSAALAEVSWRSYVEATFHANVVAYMAAKLPSWCGLTIVIFAALEPARTRSPAAESP